MPVEITEQIIECTITGHPVGDLAPLPWARTVRTKMVVTYEAADAGITYQATLERGTVEIEDSVDGLPFSPSGWAIWTANELAPRFPKALEHLSRKVCGILHHLLSAQIVEHEKDLIAAYHAACLAVVAGTDGHLDYEAKRQREDLESLILEHRKTFAPRPAPVEATTPAESAEPSVEASVPAPVN